MTASASARRRSDAVHDPLRAQILEGRLAPGDPLPSERALSESLGVNRHAVREAVKRLQQAGLVAVSHGGATRVLDWRRHGGLELLPDLTAAHGPDVLRAVMELRATIGADAARLAARRQHEGLREPLARMRRATAYEDALLAYEELWERLVDGGGNLAYRLAFNSLVAARHGHGIDATAYRAEVEDPRAAERLVEAVEAGDEAVAAALARELLERTG